MTSVMARKFRVNFKNEDFSVNWLPLAREILHETSYCGLLFQGNWNTPITQEVYKKTREYVSAVSPITLFR